MISEASMPVPLIVRWSERLAGGQLVEWLARQQTFGRGKQAIRCSGRDSEGEVVATGLCTVTVDEQRPDKMVNVWNH